MCIPPQTHLQHANELLLGDADPVPVHAVHHVDDGVCVRVVAPPVRSGHNREQQRVIQYVIMLPIKAFAASVFTVHFLFVYFSL